MAEQAEGVEGDVGRRRKFDPPRGAGHLEGMTSVTRAVTQLQPLGRFSRLLFKTFNQLMQCLFLLANHRWLTQVIVKCLFKWSNSVQWCLETPRSESGQVKAMRVKQSIQL